MKVTEEFLGLPESVRRAVAYHEAGHALLEAGEGLVGIRTLHGGGTRRW